MNEKKLEALMSLITKRKTLELSLVEIDSEITSVQSMLHAKENMVDTVITADKSLKNAEARRLAKVERLAGDESYEKLSQRLNQLKQQKSKTKIDSEECRSLYQLSLALVRWETAELEQQNLENGVQF